MPLSKRYEAELKSYFKTHFDGSEKSMQDFAQFAAVKDATMEQFTQLLQSGLFNVPTLDEMKTTLAEATGREPADIDLKPAQDGAAEISNEMRTNLMTDYFDREVLLYRLKKEYRHVPGLVDFARRGGDYEFFADSYSSSLDSREENLAGQVEDIKRYHADYADEAKRKIAYEDRVSALIERCEDYLKDHPDFSKMTDAELAKNIRDITYNMKPASLYRFNAKVEANVSPETYKKWIEVQQKAQEQLSYAMSRAKAVGSPLYGVVDLKSLDAQGVDALTSDAVTGAKNELSRYAADKTADLEKGLAADAEKLVQTSGYTKEQADASLKFYNSRREEISFDEAARQRGSFFCVDTGKQPETARFFRTDRKSGRVREYKPSRVPQTLKLAAEQQMRSRALEKLEYDSVNGRNFARLAFLNALEPDNIGKEDHRVPQTEITRRWFGAGRVFKPDGTPYGDSLAEVQEAAVAALTGKPDGYPMVMGDDGKIYDFKMKLDSTSIRSFGDAMKSYQQNWTAKVDLSRISGVIEHTEHAFSPDETMDLHNRSVEAAVGGIVKTSSVFSSDSLEFKRLQQAGEAYLAVRAWLDNDNDKLKALGYDNRNGEGLSDLLKQNRNVNKFLQDEMGHILRSTTGDDQALAENLQVELENRLQDYSAEYNRHVQENKIDGSQRQAARSSMSSTLNSTLQAKHSYENRLIEEQQKATEKKAAEKKLEEKKQAEKQEKEEEKAHKQEEKKKTNVKKN